MRYSDEAMFSAYQASRVMADKALRSVVNLRDQQQLAIALRHAGYTPTEVEKYLQDALEIEFERRDVCKYVISMELAS